MQAIQERVIKVWLSLIITVIALSVSVSTFASVATSDINAFQDLYKKQFPDLEFNDYADGVYALDADSREQWLEMEDFPPYEIAIDEGEELFNTPFANGETYASCFENEGVGVRQNFPYFDTEQKQVVTLELAINQCREKNSEKPLKYKKGDIAKLSAYMAYTSRGNKFTTDVPDDPGAIAAYENGKQFFYSRRGQLNFSCASCHIQAANNLLRADLVSPALGHVTHWPVYRAKWGEIGTLHWRFAGCNEQVYAKALPAQGESYRNLEYFLTVMSQGLNVNGPGSRK